jgi:hypothetical protein
MRKCIDESTRIIGVAIFAIALSVTAATERPIGPSWDGLNKFIKPGYSVQQTGVSNPGRDVMICIMPDTFVQAFQPYAEWKHKSGTFVKVVKFSDIGATKQASSCSTSIRPFIENAFKTWKYRPSHVLLIGDAGVFPYVKFSSATEGAMVKNNITEAYFGEYDNSNFSEPEIMVGRLSVKNTTEMTNMLQKIMNYEKNPVTTNTEWFKKIIAISSNQTNGINGGGILSGLPTYQAETVRYVSQLQLNLGFKVDTLMCTDTSSGTGFGLPSSGTPNVTLDQVISSINKGCAFINYRGTGWSDGWMTPCYNFKVADFSKIKNGGMMPFITGVGCGINMFDATPSGGFGGASEAFGELWMRAGTPDAPNGAIAVLAPPGETHSYWNNAMDSSLYIGMFKNGLWSTGQALIAAVDGMYKVPLNKDTTEYLAKCYMLLGDPSTHAWQDVPKTATLTGPTQIPIGVSEQTFSVKIGGQPVKNAQVCISGAFNDSVSYVTGFTDANGSVKLSINAPTDRMLTAYTWAKNIIPVEQQIMAGTVGIIKKSANANGSLSLAMNPFATKTISYSLPRAGSTTLAIYSPSGALVRTLALGMQSAGLHTIIWNGWNDQGVNVACGVYFISLRYENNLIRQRLTKIK